MYEKSYIDDVVVQWRAGTSTCDKKIPGNFYITISRRPYILPLFLLFIRTFSFFRDSSSPIHIIHPIFKQIQYMYALPHISNYTRTYTYTHIYTSRIITSNPYVFKTCRHSSVRFKTDRMLKDKLKKSVDHNN